jgi:hypothetical protein
MDSLSENGLISKSKVPRRQDNEGVNTYIAAEDYRAPQVKPVLSSEKGEGWFEATLPITTVSEANGGKKKSYIYRGKKCYKAEHWTDKHKRHRLQKKFVYLALGRHRAYMNTPCLITLTRHAPDKLDRFDNLPMSLKWILDAVCELITKDYRPGRADDHEGIDVIYRQEKCAECWVHVRIELGLKA